MTQGVNLLKKVAEDYSKPQDEAFDYMQNGERQTHVQHGKIYQSSYLQNNTLWQITM